MQETLKRSDALLKWRRPWGRRAWSYILLLTAVSCGAWLNLAMWRQRAASMTFEQAIDTIENSLDDKERCSAMVRLVDQIEAAAAALRSAKAESGSVGTYAGIAIERMQASTRK